MDKKSVITVVGSFNVDITAVTPRFPVGGETVFGKNITFGAGGKGTNQAIAASRCGAEIMMISKIGTDVLSDVARKTFYDEGIGMGLIFETDEASTGTAVIEVSEESGENKITVFSGANKLLTPGEVKAARTKIFDSDILLTQLETSLESVGTALKIASEYGRITVLNPAPYSDIPREWYPLIDWFIPNETETELFTGIKVTDEDSARKAAEVILSEGVKNVIITMGKKGSFYTNGKEFFRVEATESEAVDTTGAGDCFCGAFCTALGEGKSVVESMKFASCAAGISVTRAGAAASMPTRAEIDEIYLAK